MVLFPIKDYNPLERIRFQTVTVLLIAATVLAFLWQQSWPDMAVGIYRYGLVPAFLWGTVDAPPELGAVSPWLSILTSMFLHGGLMHILGNMLYLWVFGDNIEDSMGHGRFLAFYLLCGVAAALSQAAATPDALIPMVGASGAVSGVLGAYLLMHPRTHVLVVIFGRMTARLPAFAVLGLWIVMQVASAAVDDGTGGGTAWWAHIGGFVAGIILIIPMRHRGVPLLDRPPVPNFEDMEARPARRSRSRFPDSGSRN